MYEHVGSHISSRYMLAFACPALVIGLEGMRLLSGPSGTESAGPGSVVLHPQGRVVSIAVDEAGGPFRCLMVFSPVAILSRLIAVHASGKTGARTPGRLVGHFPRVLSAANAIVDDLRNYGTSPVRLNETRLEELIQLLTLAGGRDALRNWLSLASDPPTLRIADVMEAHWQDKLSLAELAFLSGMSLAAFKRSFSKLHGIPPGRWLLERRMEHAAHLLGVEGHRPSHVWQMVGFSSHTVFAQSFRRYFRMAPTDYRAARFGASRYSNRADRNTSLPRA